MNKILNLNFNKYSPSKNPSFRWVFLMFYGIIGWGEENDKKIERRKTANGNDMHG